MFLCIGVVCVCVSVCRHRQFVMRTGVGGRCMWCVGVCVSVLCVGAGADCALCASVLVHVVCVYAVCIYVQCAYGCMYVYARTVRYACRCGRQVHLNRKRGV